MVLAGGVLQQREWRIIPAIRSASGGGPNHAVGERIWIGIRILLVGFVKALKILLDQYPHPLPGPSIATSVLCAQEITTARGTATRIESPS